MADPVTHKGAGILFLTPERKALFLKRGPGGDAPGAWCFPGGTLEEGETLEQCAKREAKEELGAYPKGNLLTHTRCILPINTLQPPATGSGNPAVMINDLVDFTTFAQKVDGEFAPELNGEHTGWAWASVNEPPHPLHPGCHIALDRLTMDELGVARAMAAGSLTSPQLYGNVTLFDMRITGTGVAYRAAKMDGETKIAPEEFVYRRPENYLTPDFLARCNGLSVIMMHPVKALLNSKEFGSRIIGAMMLPYIKGDEVWGIAKIYDEDAIKMMSAGGMSTSPCVLLGNKDNQKMKTEDGIDLLIEGKPSLLDHLAICERGVWDKLGDPSGVRTDNQGDEQMFTKEQLEALNKLVADTVAAAVPGAITTAIDAARADDAGAGKKLDKVLASIDAFCGRMDTFEKKMDSHSARMDAAEDEDKKKADADDKDIAADDDDDKKKKADADDKDKKADADEDDKKKADADKEKEEAKADSARLIAATTEIAQRLVNVEKTMPKQLTDAERAEFTTVQARADEVYSALGKRAPQALNGEDLLPYRRRLMGGLKHLSPSWKDIDISTVADAAMLGVIEKAVLKDAALAALNPLDLKEGELREIVRQDEYGHKTIEFRGPTHFVRALTRSANRVTHIGARKEV